MPGWLRIPFIHDRLHIHHSATSYGGIWVLMSRWAKLLVLAILLTVALSGCEFFFSSSRSHSRFSEPRSFTRDFSFEVTDNFTPLRLAMDLTLLQGKLQWELVDPNGNHRWTGTVRDQEILQESRLLDPIVGIWHFSVECKQAAGDFLFEWSGFRRIRS